MLQITHSELREPLFPRAVITIGNFDGVHRGHRALLRHVVARAAELDAKSIVYTFSPHPLKVLNPSFCPPMITSFEDRLELIAAEGVDALVWARFDRDYASLEPEDFARNTLRSKLGLVELWVGPDFAFGRGRSGSIELLRRIGWDEGYSVQVLRPFTLRNEVVSSTRIRRAIQEADFAVARCLLGRPYRMKGPVVHGAGRGRTLGFPTANILPREDCIPHPGVYAAWVEIDTCSFPAAVNIGPNPTFGGSQISVEAFLLDFQGDLYGRDVSLRFVAAVRGEIAFRDPTALVQQIHKDVEAVRRLLDADRENTPPANGETD